MIKEIILDFPGGPDLIIWILINTKSFLAVVREPRDDSIRTQPDIVGFEDEEGAMGWGMQEACESQKREELDSSQEVLETNEALPTPIC